MSRSALGHLALLGSLTMSTLTLAGTAEGHREGVWGGDRVQLTVGASESRLEGDCLAGRLSGALVPRRDGHFDATGSFEEFGPGPQAGDPVDAASARFTGVINNGVMTLSVFPAGAKAAQVFTLHQGVKIKLVRCQ